MTEFESDIAFIKNVILALPLSQDVLTCSALSALGRIVDKQLTLESELKTIKDRLKDDPNYASLLEDLEDL